MRITAISKRLILQLLRDRRTLMLLFLAPLFIMTLLFFIFQSSDTSQIKVGVHHIPNALAERLKEEDIEIVKVADDDILTTIERHNLDALITDKQSLDVYYTNDTPAHTMKIKQVIKSYELQEEMQATEVVIKNIESQYETLKAQMESLKSKFGPLLERIGIEDKQLKENEALKQGKVKVHYIYGDKNTDYFDRINPILIAFFVFFFTFLISGITLLKERTHGTLKKLLSTPVRRYEIVLGYLVGFSPFAVVQTILIVLYSVYVLGIHVEGSVILLVLMNILLSFTALGLGLFISTFASDEFQMIQFIPLIIVPQILFSGIIPIASMHPVLRIISYAMPLKYGADNLSRIMFKGQGIELLYINIFVLFMFLIVFTVLNIILLKKHRNI